MENELNELHVFEIENEINTCENENIANEELHVTGEGEISKC